MNADRRKELREVQSLITKVEVPDVSAALEQLVNIVEILERVKDEEQEALENMPESQQDGEKGDTMRENVQNMENAMECAEKITDILRALDEMTSEKQDFLDYCNSAENET